MEGGSSETDFSYCADHLTGTWNKSPFPEAPLAPAMQCACDVQSFGNELGNSRQKGSTEQNVKFYLGSEKALLSQICRLLYNVRIGDQAF